MKIPIFLNYSVTSRIDETMTSKLEILKKTTDFVWSKNDHCMVEWTKNDNLVKYWQEKSTNIS